MFYTIKELVKQAQEYSSIAELMIATEMENTGRSREKIVALMEKNLEAMEQSVRKGIAGVTSITKLTGGAAPKLDKYLKTGNALCGDTVVKAARNAIAVNEVNAQMGIICEPPQQAVQVF